MIFANKTEVIPSTTLMKTSIVELLSMEILVAYQKTFLEEQKQILENIFIHLFTSSKKERFMIWFLIIQLTQIFLLR